MGVSDILKSIFCGLPLARANGTFAQVETTSGVPMPLVCFNNEGLKILEKEIYLPNGRSFDLIWGISTALHSPAWVATLIFNKDVKIKPNPSVYSQDQEHECEALNTSLSLRNESSSSVQVFHFNKLIEPVYLNFRINIEPNSGISRVAIQPQASFWMIREVRK